MGGGSRTEPRLHHCTPAWVTERDSFSNNNNNNNNKQTNKQWGNHSPSPNRQGSDCHNKHLTGKLFYPTPVLQNMPGGHTGEILSASTDSNNRDQWENQWYHMNQANRNNVVKCLKIKLLLEPQPT